MLRYKTKASLISNVLYDRYLVLLPHADDELIGCDQLLKSNATCLVVNMDMDGDDSDKLHQIRYQELQSYINSIKRELITISDDKIEGLTKIISEYNPSVICVPSCFDWHPEHFQVMQYLQESLYKNAAQPLIAMYQVSVPLLSDYINMALPMNKAEYDEKWNGFNYYYKSQKHLPAFRFGANERVNGKLLKTFAAESYIVFDNKRWCSIINKALNIEMGAVLRPHVNNLINIRKHLFPLYDMILNQNGNNVTKN